MSAEIFSNRAKEEIVRLFVVINRSVATLGHGKTRGDTEGMNPAEDKRPTITSGRSDISV